MDFPAWKYDINNDQDNLPLWNVVLTGDFAVIMTSVHARSERDAETLARNFLVDYYDMNLDSFSTEATRGIEVKWMKIKGLRSWEGGE